MAGAQLVFVSATSAGATAACDTNGLDGLDCDGLASNAGGEAVVASYTDGNGNSAQLTARDGFLYCQWDASVNAHAIAGFVPSDYASGCSITGETSGGTAECAAARRTASESTDAAGPMAGGGTAAGECKLVELELVSRENIRWSLTVYGFEFSVWRTETNAELRETASELSATGGCGGGVEVEAIFAGRAGLAVVELFGGCSGSVSGSVSNKVSRLERTDIEVFERRAVMMGFTNLFVSTVAKVTDIAWSGKTHGCDGLDMVEFLIDEREIDGYSVSMSTEGAPSGSMKVNLQNSELDGVTDDGTYNAVIEETNGFTATFTNDVGFSSSIAFDVDYEYPEVLVETRMPAIMLSAGSGEEYVLETLLTAVNGTVYGANLLSTDVPVENVSAGAAAFTSSHLAAHDGNLAKAIADLFVTNHTMVESASFDAAGPCSPLELPPDPQPWTATGSVASLSGASTGKATTRALLVDVIMDLAYIPPIVE